MEENKNETVNVKEEQKEVALRCMKNFKLMDQICNEFEKEGTLYYSERMNQVFDGILYWISNKPEWAQKIKELEEEYDILVYHCYYYRASYGEILDCLYVSGNEEDWEETVEDTKDGYANIFAINLTIPEYSEFGSSIYCPKNGGISKQ